MTSSPADRVRTFQGLPTRPLRPGGLARVATVVEAPAEERTEVRYDTAGRRLAEHGIDLRRLRVAVEAVSGGGRDGEGGATGEWRLTLPTGTELSFPAADTLPQEADDRVRAYAGNRPLGPVRDVRVRRERTVFLDRRGRPLAELDRSEVVARPVARARGLVEGWACTEIRLLEGGGRRLLDALGRRLRAQGLRPGEADGAGDGAVAGGASGPGRAGPAADTSLGAAVTGYLRLHCAELLALDGAVRRDEEDSVHRMRVCARRLRSCLTSCRRYLRGPAGDRLAEELRWLGQALGTARDAESTGERLAAQAVQAARAAQGAQAAAMLDDLAGRITDRFRRRYRDAYRQVREVLDSERYFDLLAALEELAARPRLRARAKRGSARGTASLERLLRREQVRTDRRMRAAPALPAGPHRDEALHAARKAAKRTRYTAELAGPGGAKLARRMRALQEGLGAYQDAVVAEELLPYLAAQARAEGEDT
ncbi:CHAD domain-containing protein, partial [Kitasatospora nipponensis]|uniref:CHAD domain-containing protein n=1 Tax=Kitasatospora nipponensis TaxID=258049 RepID=UPI0031D5EDF1